ncbi:MAG: hypothetical protein ACP5RZ_01140 [Thermoplasmata archaeon]
MRIDLENYGKDESYEIRLQISLIKNAEGMLPYYEEKRDKFEEYIHERIKKIKEILNVEHAEVFENGRIIFKF